MNDLVLLTQGDRHCVTVYAPVIPPQDWLGYQPFLQSLEAAMATANRRLTGRGVSQDIRRAIQQQFRQFTKRTGYEGLSVALFVTAESATGFLLPDRIEAAVRVADHFDLGPLLRAVTMAHHSYGVTLTEHDWGLWEATSAEPAQLLGGSSRDDAPGGDPRAMLFRLFRWVTAGSAYFLSRRAFVARALAGVRERLAVLDPQHEGLVVLFPDDDAFVGWRSDVVEEAGLGRPVEVVMGDADGLTPAGSAASCAVTDAASSSRSSACGSPGCAPRTPAAIPVPTWRRSRWPPPRAASEPSSTTPPTSITAGSTRWAGSPPTSGATTPWPGSPSTFSPVAARPTRSLRRRSSPAPWTPPSSPRSPTRFPTDPRQGDRNGTVPRPPLRRPPPFALTASLRELTACVRTDRSSQGRGARREGWRSAIWVHAPGPGQVLG